jgi:hypothetical protein
VAACAEAQAVDDFSSVFPAIEGCTRKVESLKRDGSIIAQDASYDGCGSVSILIVPGTRRAREANWHEYFPTQKMKVQGYDAWQNSPLCGNDPWLGGIDVYFSDDGVLRASAMLGGAALLDFAKTADYRAIRRMAQVLQTGRR